MTANVLRRQMVIGATVNMDSLEKTVKVSLHKLMYSLSLFIFNVLEFALILDTTLHHQVMYDFESYQTVGKGYASFSLRYDFFRGV